MDVIAELARMAGAAGRLWLRRLPTIGVWISLGWSIRTVTLMGSVLVGSHLVWSLMFLVVGMLAWVVCLVMMLHSLSDDLTSVDVLDRADEEFPAARRSRREVLLEAVIPFLAVYAVWGLTEEQIRRAFSANLTYHGSETANFSITFAAWPLYLGVAVGAWILQAVVGWIGRRRSGPGRPPQIGQALLLTLLRGTSLITAFIGLDSVWTRVTEWFYTRRLWQWIDQGWAGFLEWLPDWRFVWDVTLPEALEALMSGLWNYVVPGLFDAVLLPLVWLALTAMVFGWHEFAVSARRLRLPPFLALRLERAQSASPFGALRAGYTALAEDLLPAVQALRLLLRSGLGFLAAYLLLSALARALGTWVNSAVLWLIGPNSFAETLVYSSAVAFVGEFVAWSVAACVYITAFDRAMNRAIRSGSPVLRTPPGAAPEPTTPPVAGPARSMPR